jgi:hypothetical protein
MLENTAAMSRTTRVICYVITDTDNSKSSIQITDEKRTGRAIILYLCCLLGIIF